MLFIVYVKRGEKYLKIFKGTKGNGMTMNELDQNNGIVIDECSTVRTLSIHKRKKQTSVWLIEMHECK